MTARLAPPSLTGPGAPDVAPDRPLRASAARWLAWASVSRVGRDVINVLGRLALARLLWPEAFGIFALAFAVVEGAKLVCELQLEPAIVQRPDLGDDLLATAHWSLTALGALGALALAGLAAPIGGVLGHPEIVHTVQLLSLQIPLDAVAAVP